MASFQMVGFAVERLVSFSSLTTEVGRHDARRERSEDASSQSLLQRRHLEKAPRLDTPA